VEEEFIRVHTSYSGVAAYQLQLRNCMHPDEFLHFFIFLISKTEQLAVADQRNATATRPALVAP
jgi:hypothetical protein